MTSPIFAVENTHSTRDPEQVYAMLYGHALDGNSSAQHRLALMCLNGQGTVKDAVEAVKWFRLAAEDGKPESQEQLALALMSGNGVGKDNIEAVKWLSLAGQQDSPTALYILANMYINGEGVQKNKRKAYELFEKSADLGFTRSLLTQANMLIYGDGVKKNVYEGILRVEKAALAGDYYAKSQLPELKKQRLCLFSAKTQLFGKYIKCVSSKELHVQILNKGATLITERSGKFKKVYDSKQILKGSQFLEVDLLASHKVARLKYFFRKQLLNPELSERVYIKKNYITKIRKILESKYGGFEKITGVLGAGEIKYEWRLSDSTDIILHQLSHRSQVTLEYSFSDRVEIYLAETNAKNNKVLNEGYTFDRDVF